MSNNSALSHFPLVRILVPFALGIMAGRLFQSIGIVAPIVMACICIATYVALHVLYKGRITYRHRACFAFIIALFALALGWINIIVSRPVAANLQALNGKYVAAQINDVRFGDNSMQIRAKMLFTACRHKTVACKPVNVLITTRGCNYVLKCGDVIAFKGTIEEIKNYGNPHEFDHKQYEYDRGFIYTTHIDKTSLRKIGHRSTWRSKLAEMQANIKHAIFSSHLSPNVQHIIIALVLGDDSLIDSDTRNDFSIAGIAHILALSGMHVGIIVLILWWFLMPLDYFKLKKLRLVLTLVCLFAFAVFTGLSPSVMRATIMAAFVIIGRVLYRKSVSFNSLLGAALIILVFNPVALFNVGFQLSFIVVGALLAANYKVRLMHPHRHGTNYFLTLLYTSLVAMLSTIAITAYYFHTISFASFLSNLLILPIFPLFMILSVVCTFLIIQGIEVDWVNSVLNGMYNYISSVIDAVNSFPIGHIDGVYVDAFALIAYYVILLLLFAWLFCKQWRYMLASGCCLIAVLLDAAIYMYKLPSTGWVVFNSLNSTPILYFQGHNAWLWQPDVDSVDIDLPQFKRTYRGFLSYYQIDSITAVSQASQPLNGTSVFKPPFAMLNGSTFMVAGNGQWKRSEQGNNYTFDYIVVTKKYHSDMKTLMSLYSGDSILLSGDIYSNDLIKLENECKQSVLNFRSLKQSGAVQRYNR